MSLRFAFASTTHPEIRRKAVFQQVGLSASALILTVIPRSHSHRRNTIIFGALLCLTLCYTALSRRVLERKTRSSLYRPVVGGAFRLLYSLPRAATAISLFLVLNVVDAQNWTKYGSTRRGGVSLDNPTSMYEVDATAIARCERNETTDGRQLDNERVESTSERESCVWRMRGSCYNADRTRHET